MNNSRHNYPEFCIFPQDDPLTKVNYLLGYQEGFLLHGVLFYWQFGQCLQFFSSCNILTDQSKDRTSFLLFCHVLRCYLIEDRHRIEHTLNFPCIFFLHNWLYCADNWKCFFFKVIRYPGGIKSFLLQCMDAYSWYWWLCWTFQFDNGWWNQTRPTPLTTNHHLWCTYLTFSDISQRTIIHVNMEFWA